MIDWKASYQQVSNLSISLSEAFLKKESKSGWHWHFRSGIFITVCCLFVYYSTLHRGKTCHPVGQTSQSMCARFSSLCDIYIMSPSCSVKRCSVLNTTATCHGTVKERVLNDSGFQEPKYNTRIVSCSMVMVVWCLRVLMFNQHVYSSRSTPRADTTRCRLQSQLDIY